jgi:F-type H+-transporting ATPase subunit epsilon
MSAVNIEIITPEKVSYKDTVDVITVPGTKGNFQILKDHAPLMSTIDIGIITVKKDKEIINFTSGDGTIEVLNNEVLILVDSLENTDDIDLERAELAKQRAEERLAKKHLEDIDIVRAEAALKRAINRISATSKVAS